MDQELRAAAAICHSGPWSKPELLQIYPGSSIIRNGCPALFPISRELCIKWKYKRLEGCSSSSRRHRYHACYSSRIHPQGALASNDERRNQDSRSKEALAAKCVFELEGAT